jgi:hypothetical protein
VINYRTLEKNEKRKIKTRKKTKKEHTSEKIIPLGQNFFVFFRPSRQEQEKVGAKKGRKIVFPFVPPHRPFFSSPPQAIKPHIVPLPRSIDLELQLDQRPSISTKTIKKRTNKGISTNRRRRGRGGGWALSAGNNLSHGPVIASSTTASHHIDRHLRLGRHPHRNR